MRKFEVITKPTNTVKLTIAKDRVTVKLPESITLVNAERIVKFFKKVADKNPSPEFTLRGNGTPENVMRHGIAMYSGIRPGRKPVNEGSYKFEE
ncbi:predicted ORF [Xanthomonas phage XacN1]|nr:predicted ORF [Xanthomonas phage XacN1]BBA65711.1 predicted ORF [Xanthomonas phage XacN1]